MDVVEGIVWNQIGNRFDNSGSSDLFYEKKWEWKYLRKACANLYLEELYKLYMHRLQRSYLSIFLILQTVIAVVHTTLLLVVIIKLIVNAEESPEIIPFLFSSPRMSHRSQSKYSPT